MSEIEFTAKSAHDPSFDLDRLASQEKKKKKKKVSEESSKKLHRRLYGWYIYEKDAQSINRYQQAIDSDFKDGLQWNDEDANVLMERGQAPLVYNKIKPAIDWILGTEKRTRIDFNIVPRRKEQNKEAEAKKNLLKYLSDVNKAVFAKSRAFDDAVTAGVGWLEDSICSDDTRELLQTGYESWTNILHDSRSRARDLSDSRYLFREKYIDLDIAYAMFPDKKLLLKQSSERSNEIKSDQFNEIDDFIYSSRFEGIDQNINTVFSGRNYAYDASSSTNRRQRVKLIECWYREPFSKNIMRGGDYDGDEYDANNADHVSQVTEEFASLTHTIVMQMYCAIMTEDHVLQNVVSPYKHNGFPFTPVWGYLRKRDNMPYGAIRNIRDPQESLNKRMSKALHILSTNQIIADEDAATDWDLIREEAANPAGLLLLDGVKGARFELNNDKQLAQQHINIMNIDSQMIQDVSGITDENLGRDTNATSGKAITARQEQGAVIVAELFDNLRFAVQIQGEKQLALIEQFYDQEKIVRIVGNRGHIDFMSVNQVVFDEQSQKNVLINPITASQADFVVDEQDYQASMRRAMFDTMNELLRTLPPEVSLQLLDLVYDNSDLPGREEIVSRIRQINGQEDPNAEETPELLAKKAAKEEAEAKEKAAQEQLRQLEIDERRAKMEKSAAETVTKTIEGIELSISAAEKAALLPSILPIADQIAKSSGFVDKDGGAIAVAPEVNQSLPMPPGIAQGTETLQ